ncbi:hypothetical protein SAMN02787076_05904 [Rhizobacter sp. OV335]|jgi:hypothetical protein|nr:hypothetical protein SAMN02787076_05904 [Rhizobacter sp. OV335]
MEEVAVLSGLREYARPMFWFVLYCLGVQCVQSSSRAIAVLGLATAATVLSVRFQGVFLGAWVTAVVQAVRDRSLDVFRPRYLFNRVGQAITQTGQTVCILFASMQMSGQLQSAISMAVVPVWTLLVGGVLSLLGKRPRIDGAAWIAPAMYAVSANMFAIQAPKTEGSVALGFAFMLGSGLCTTLLHYLTEDVARKDELRNKLRDLKLRIVTTANDAPVRESKITTTLWQNGPAALLTVPLWFIAVPGLSLDRATVPATWLGVTLVVSVAVFSLGQQLATQLAYISSEGTDLSVARLNTLRGVQVIFAAILDVVLFQVLPGRIQWSALALVPLTIAVGWLLTTSKKAEDGSTGSATSA